MLADAVAQGAREDDCNPDDRRHRSDAHDSERRAAAQRFVHGGEQQRPAQDRAEGDDCYGQRPPSRSGAADTDRGARLERPERELCRRHEPAREKRRSGIETHPGERDAIPRSEQCEAERGKRSSPEDKPGEQHGDTRDGGDTRRPGQFARGQSDGEREQRRTDERSDARRYARIALAKRLNADTSSRTGSSGSPQRHCTTDTPSLRKRLRTAARRSFQSRYASCA